MALGDLVCSASISPLHYVQLYHHVLTFHQHWIRSGHFFIKILVSVADELVLQYRRSDWKDYW